MNTTAKVINRRVIKILRSYTDNNYVDVIQNKHIKVIGTYGGVTRSFPLSPSPTHSNYERSVRSYLNRFLQSVGCPIRITSSMI